MFWMAFIAVATTAVTVGMGVAGMVVGNQQTDKMIKNQEKWELAQADITLGQSLVSAPGAIPT